MAWNETDTRTADERTADYFRDKMAKDPQNAAFWAAVEHETCGRWHLDIWEDAALTKPTLDWLEKEIYPRCNATQECEKVVLRMLCFLCKGKNIAWDTGIYMNICRLAKRLREKGWEPGQPIDENHSMLSKYELNRMGQLATQSKGAPPVTAPTPDEAEVAAKGEDLSGKQLIFVKMLLEQWKHYYETKLTMTDEAAAATVDGTPIYTSDKSQATVYNKWKQRLPKELRPPKSKRGGKRSHK